MANPMIIAVLVYSHVTAFYLGVHIQDRIRFQNPRYLTHIVVALVWPVLLPRCVYYRLRAYS